MTRSLLEEVFPGKAAAKPSYSQERADEDEGEHDHEDPVDEGLEELVDDEKAGKFEILEALWVVQEVVLCPEILDPPG
jgi:hypothetical protein